MLIAQRAGVRTIYNPAPAADIPAELLAEGRTLRDAMLAEVCGADAPQEIRTAYTVLTGLSSHGLSAMRDMLGSPLRVSAVEIKQGGREGTIPAVDMRVDQ